MKGLLSIPRQLALANRHRKQMERLQKQLADVDERIADSKKFRGIILGDIEMLKSNIRRLAIDVKPAVDEEVSRG